MRLLFPLRASVVSACIWGAASADAASSRLAFEANRGQAASSVAFVARGSGGTLFLTNDGATLSAGSELLRIVPVGGRSVSPEGVDLLRGTVSYFRGADPARHLHAIPTWARVAYRDVWPGIDVVLHGDDTRVEVDYVVAPGVDPSAIGVAFPGARSTYLDGGGNLVVGSARGELRLSRPVATSNCHQRLPSFCEKPLVCSIPR